MKKNERLAPFSAANMNKIQQVREELLSERLSDRMEKAKNGDVIEATEILPLIANALSTKNCDRHGTPYPVPDCIRDYLSEILFNILKRKDAEIKKNINTKKKSKNNWHKGIAHDFNLTKSGRKNEASNFEKRLVADLVFQVKYSNIVSVDKACEIVIGGLFEADKKIREIEEKMKTEKNIKKLQLYRWELVKYSNYRNVCSKFKNKRIAKQDGRKEVEKWYNNYKDELESMYRKAGLIISN